MRPRKAANRDLPPRMIRRVRSMKNGSEWVGYYYDGRDDQGKRKEIPLGGDLDVAKAEWAKLDCKPIPQKNTLLGKVFDRYEAEIIPAKKPRTQKDNLLSLTQLRKAFSEAPINAVTPQVIAQYRDKRTGKVRANREISLLSHIYNIAREWGITDKENPASGVRKNKETPRDFYADARIWNAVYGVAVPELKDAMDLAYLTGQRPADVLSMRTTDVTNSFLLVAQGKTSKKLRIRLDAGEIINGLGELIEKLLVQRKARAVRNPYLIITEDGRRVTAPMLRLRFDDARNVAIAKALEDEDAQLASSIRQFQFRDIRPKAASEIDDLGHASRLLGHTDKRITETVYRRVGEIVKPTR
ncbi:tyrosine-type recombinase/integrase [Pseudomonas sp. SCA2728.1_7]|uniref:tyrosine-type recombinase/integrase n=1 Tax=Pseudomonas sp. SCA2728.1_7 TaxID=2825975 RepID=UPI001BB03FD7|nr:tyrosine-type recombinase/integrase [Pseudomonas sp. SCA2728.1_7]QUE91174.1 tyrosine-type recombinase/integrase [Pseudomonas sp. SCA2728.1_7]